MDKKFKATHSNAGKSLFKNFGFRLTNLLFHQEKDGRVNNFETNKFSGPAKPTDENQVPVSRKELPKKFTLYIRCARTIKGEFSQPPSRLFQLKHPLAPKYLERRIQDGFFPQGRIILQGPLQVA